MAAVKFWLLLTLLAGCGRLGFQDDAVSAGDAGLDPLVDRDRDGVADALDNCAVVANTDQHDEDEDRVGDVCDDCPVTSNLDQADADRDGVGDLCDPRPRLGGDSIASFDPFSGPTLSARWVVQTGRWVVAGDAVSQTEVGTDLRMYDRSLMDLPDLRLEARVTFDGFDSGDRNAALVARLDPAKGDGSVSGVFLDAAGAVGALKIWALVGGTAGNPIEFPISPPKLSAPYLLRFDASGTTLGAKLTGPSSASVATTTGAATAGVTSGLRTNRARATYSYFIAYRLGGPL
jgi:Thrombospondin type 3 repeat